MDSVAGAIENIPGYNIAVDAWNDYAGEHLQTKDPFYEELPNGDTRRRKAPEGVSDSDKKVWKIIVKKAWSHDRSFCGCFAIDLGLGLAPIISMLPLLGPLWMYALHGRLVSEAEQLRIPAELQAKMSANILFDFLITLPPVIGSFLSWMNACSTRNAALVHTFLMRKAEAQRQNLGPFNITETTYVPMQPQPARGSSRPQTNTRAMSAQTQSLPQPQFKAHSQGPKNAKLGQPGQQQSGYL